MKHYTANNVLAVLVKAQLHCRGEFPVVVRTADGDKEVTKAYFNPNSGNVELTLKG